MYHLKTGSIVKNLSAFENYFEMIQYDLTISG